MLTGSIVGTPVIKKKKKKKKIYGSNKEPENKQICGFVEFFFLNITFTLSLFYSMLTLIRQKKHDLFVLPRNQKIYPERCSRVRKGTDSPLTVIKALKSLKKKNKKKPSHRKHQYNV